MRVGAEHRGRAAVEVMRERDLLARRLRVDVDEHGRRRLARLVDEPVDQLPHAPRRIEEQRAEDVDDSDLGSVAAPATIVSPRPGASEAKFAGRTTRSLPDEVGRDLDSPPRVVPERDRVGAGSEDPVCEPWRDPDPVRGVLAVDDAEVDLELVRAAAAGASRPRRDRVDRRRHRRRAFASARDQGSRLVEGYTEIATLLPSSVVCAASACSSTFAMCDCSSRASRPRR